MVEGGDILMVGKLMGEERGGEEWEKEFVNILKILQWCCDGWWSDDVRESGSRKREESNFQLFIFLALKPQSIPLLLDCIEAFCPQQNCAGKKENTPYHPTFTMAIVFEAFFNLYALQLQKIQLDSPLYFLLFNI